MVERRTEITEVVRDRIVSGLHLGSLTQDQRLPSSREVAREFGVAPRMATAVYRQLEREGLVEVRPRSGIYLSATRINRGMPSQSVGWVVDQLLQGMSRGTAPIQLPERLRRSLETRKLSAVCVAANRDQLYSLHAELRGDYGFETTSIDVDQLWSESDGVQSALQQADLLVTIALHTAEVQRRARELRIPCIVVTLHSDMLTETTRRLAREPVYFVATDPRFGDALHRLFEPTGRAGNVRLVVLGRDDPSSIPDDAPTYIMRSAFDQLGKIPLTERAAPTLRVFSSKTARELLTFIVRANINALTAHHT